MKELLEKLKVKGELVRQGNGKATYRWNGMLFVVEVEESLPPPPPKPEKKVIRLLAPVVVKPTPEIAAPLPRRKGVRGRTLSRGFVQKANEVLEKQGPEALGKFIKKQKRDLWNLKGE